GGVRAMHRRPGQPHRPGDLRQAHPQRARHHRAGPASVSGHPVRAKSAIVGVADAASPTGDLDLHGRALEAAMVREALDDAGLALTDVDALFASGEAMGLAEFRSEEHTSELQSPD